MTYPMHNWAPYWLFTMVYACVPHFNLWRGHKHPCSFQLRIALNLKSTRHGDWPGQEPGQEQEIPNLYLYSRKEDGSLEKVQLEQTEVEKDIGVYVDQKLSFQEQITNKTNKANSTMGIIRRTFDHLDRKTFTQLYKNLVRPHLEVSNSAWVPYKKQDIELIEAVQRRATRQIHGYSQMQYEERLRLLGLPTLTFRRLRGDMIETYKILPGVYDKEVGPKLPKGTSATRGHSKKIFKRGSRLNIRKYFFTIRVATNWNGLPEEIINAKNTQAFKNALDKHWRNHPSKYNYLHNPYSNLS